MDTTTIPKQPGSSSQQLCRRRCSFPHAPTTPVRWFVSAAVFVVTLSVSLSLLALAPCTQGIPANAAAAAGLLLPLLPYHHHAPLLFGSTVASSTTTTTATGVLLVTASLWALVPGVGGISVNVAVLLPFDDRYLFSYRRLAPAIQVAIAELNRDTALLRRHRLIVRFNNSDCNIAVAMDKAITFFMNHQVKND